MAIKFGADALGLVGHMPSGPGVISDNLIAEIAEYAPPPIATFLLTSETTAKGVIKHHKKVNTSVIQLVDKLTEGTIEDIKEALPAIKIVQVIHVTGESSINEAIEAAKSADSILLDSGDPGKQVKELGGTGRTHNWDISREIVETIKKPVFLAGGLRDSNVRDAIDFVGPFGLDICSGVRTDGELNEFLLEDFFQMIHDHENYK